MSQKLFLRSAICKNRGLYSNLSLSTVRSPNTVFLSARSHSTGDDLREKARQRIAEVESKQKINANTPIGLMDRTPGSDINETPTYFDDFLTDGERKRFEPFPNNVNPKTGEKSGPTGPEPTRYGDWERKGRCSDF